MPSVRLLRRVFLPLVCRPHGLTVYAADGISTTAGCTVADCSARFNTLDGIEADVERMRFYAESSPAIGTSLNPYIGYEEVARVIKKAMAENKTLREVILEEGLMDEADVDRALDVEAMTRGGIL